MCTFNADVSVYCLKKYINCVYCGFIGNSVQIVPLTHSLSLKISVNVVWKFDIFGKLKKKYAIGINRKTTNSITKNANFDTKTVLWHLFNSYSCLRLVYLCDLARWTDSVQPHSIQWLHVVAFHSMAWLWLVWAHIFMNMVADLQLSQYFTLCMFRCHFV